MGWSLDKNARFLMVYLLLHGIISGYAVSYTTKRKIDAFILKMPIVALTEIDIKNTRF